MSVCPWHKQNGEPAVWHARFVAAWLPQMPGRLHGRTVEEAWRLWRQSTAGRHSRARRPGREWHRAAAKYNWHERGDAYDDHIRRMMAAGQEQERIAMLREHADIAQAMRIRASRVLLEWPMEDVFDPPLEVALEAGMRRVRVRKGLASMLEESPSEMRRWILEGIKGEREARGVSSAVMELALSVSSKTTEELLAELDSLRRTGDAGLTRQRSA
jgi:hypothetical protein